MQRGKCCASFSSKRSNQAKSSHLFLIDESAVFHQLGTKRAFKSKL
jgi:hypothetical protein